MKRKTKTHRMDSFELLASLLNYFKYHEYTTDLTGRVRKYKSHKALDEFIAMLRRRETAEAFGVPWPKTVFLPYPFWTFYVSGVFPGAKMDSILRECLKSADGGKTDDPFAQEMELTRILNERFEDRYSDDFMEGYEELKSLYQQLSCLTAWRPMQDIVFFDSDVLEEFANIKTGEDDRMPIDVLYQFPSWCAYFDMGRVEFDGREYSGFFAQRDSVLGRNLFAVTFCGGERALDTGIHYYSRHRICLDLDKPTFRESLLSIKSDIPGDSQKDMNPDDPVLNQVMNMVLYVCAHGLGEKK